MNLNSPLPASTSQETLETISKNKMALRFNPELFELRYENLRDKGIDVIVEIKQNGYYTNFRFAIQLKATASTHPDNGAVKDRADTDHVIGYCAVT